MDFDERIYLFSTQEHSKLDENMYILLTTSRNDEHINTWIPTTLMMIQW